MLSSKVGYDISTPHGAERLQKDIESQTGERLSVNTIKRLSGLLPYEGSQRGSTLDIFARYLGYADAKELLAFMEGNASDFRLPPNFIDLSSLPAGAKVVLEWTPGRRITMRHIDGASYSVEESVNSKLWKGDVLETGVVAKGIPFVVRNVAREGGNLGPYTAAQENGLTKIEIVAPR